jgi:O-glycosyl hydrolase
MIRAVRFSWFLALAPSALALALVIGLSHATAHSEPVVQWWSSSEDMLHTLTPQPELAFTPQRANEKASVLIDGETTYQTILGLGSSLEHSTCYNLSRLPPDRLEQALESLVHPTKGIGMSLMRICIGTPDFTASPWYTYDDLLPDQKDPELRHFSIAKDREYVLPIIKLARKLNPQLKFLASPWSPPGWMKTNDRICGGKINPDHFPHYAEYLARFVEAYRDEGIDIHAITVQNEPEFNPASYPTCGWTAPQQRDFIRDHLGPVFRNHGLRTLIWCFDHNFNHPGYPASLLRDPQAAQYIDGSGFHLYEGKPSAMSKLHDEFPDKHIYFTEGSTYEASGAVEIMTYFRNWARSYNAWVTLIDHQMKPNPGPHECSPTCMVLDRNTLKLTYRFDYYMYGHFTRFISPGAVRIGSTMPSKQPANVAFRNPDGSLVVIAANPETRTRGVSVAWNGLGFGATLAPKSVATFRWTP